MIHLAVEDLLFQTSLLLKQELLLIWQEKNGGKKFSETAVTSTVLPHRKCSRSLL